VKDGESRHILSAVKRARIMPSVFAGPSLAVIPLAHPVPALIGVRHE
jgi:hypothetical protein